MGATSSSSWWGSVTSWVLAFYYAQGFLLRSGLSIGSGLFIRSRLSKALRAFYYAQGCLLRSGLSITLRAVYALRAGLGIQSCLYQAANSAGIGTALNLRLDDTHYLTHVGHRSSAGLGDCRLNHVGYFSVSKGCG